MLKPQSGRDLSLAALPASSGLLIPETLAWNLSSPDDLPATLSRLREAQRHINRLVEDAEAQAIHFLRRGLLNTHLLIVKKAVERFYPFSESLFRTCYDYSLLDAGVVNENIHVISNRIDYSFWKGFFPDWAHISGHLSIPLAAFEKHPDEWHWDEAAANPLIDWNIKSIKRHFRKLTNYFTAISANTGLNWTSELLRAFADRWDYSTDGLLGNDTLPWDDENIPALLLAIAPEDAELDKDELTEIAAEMRLRYWERRSLNRHLSWTTDELRQHTSELDWGRLSSNPSLPFSFALLAEFADYWDWDALAANLGFYQQILSPLLSDSVVQEFLGTVSLR